LTIIEYNFKFSKGATYVAYQPTPSNYLRRTRLSSPYSFSKSDCKKTRSL